MRSDVLRPVVLIAVLALGFSPVAQAASGDDRIMSAEDFPPPEAFAVPWTVFDGTYAAAASAPLIVYWAPATAGEVKGSDMTSSPVLTTASARCVGMFVLHPEDTISRTKWGLAGTVPVALLTADDKVLARVDGTSGKLRVFDVEDMVRHELDAREAALDKLLNRARKKTRAGDREGAIADYQSVWNQRCVAPLKANAAQRELARLGVRL